MKLDDVAGLSGAGEEANAENVDAAEAFATEAEAGSEAGNDAGNAGELRGSVDGVVEDSAAPPATGEGTDGLIGPAGESVEDEVERVCGEEEAPDTDEARLPGDPEATAERKPVRK